MSKANLIDVTSFLTAAGQGSPIAAEAIPESHLYGQVFEVHVNIPTGNTAYISLKTLLETDPVFAQYHGDSATPDVVVQFDAVEPVLLNGAHMAYAEKIKIVQNLQWQATRSGKVDLFPIGLSVHEPFRTAVLAQASPAAAALAQFDGNGPFVFPGAQRCNLRKEDFGLAFKAAAPTHSGGTDLIVRLWGSAVPVSGSAGFDAAIRDPNQALSVLKSRYLANMTAAAARASFG